MNNDRPNLIYILADQLGYSRCGYAGDEKARTPNIDDLASQGVNFWNPSLAVSKDFPDHDPLFMRVYKIDFRRILEFVNFVIFRSRKLLLLLA